MTAPDDVDSGIPDSYGYDEVGTRTRQAWLRTSLVVIVVTLLAERALIITDRPRMLLALPLIPGVLLLTVAAVRSHRLRSHESAAMPRSTIAFVLGGVIALAVIVAVGVSIGVAAMGG